MNWDWEKLQQRRGRPSPSNQTPPEFGQFGDKLRNIRRFSGSGKFVVLGIILLWLASGIYIVDPAEVGVVQRFGAFNRITEPGPHYHLPYPVESVQTPKVSEIRRIEIGFRSRGGEFQQGDIRVVPDESMMLTGDENIVDVQFIVQYQIKDPVNYLFNVAEQTETVKNAAEAAMREVIGKNLIDSALTTGKFEIQNETLALQQEILDRYQAGIRVVAVQLQDVHPPAEVIDAFKDVASAREDKSRFINEADAYRNDVIPKARGQAAVVVNEAQAYEESTILKAQGDAARFTSVLTEYQKAPAVTRQRLYLETMENILSGSGNEKLILGPDALDKTMPLLPLSGLGQQPLGRPSSEPAPPTMQTDTSGGSSASGGQIPRTSQGRARQ